MSNELVPASALVKKRAVRHALSSLYLDVTDRCNLRCDYCSAAAGPDGEQMLDVRHAVGEVRRWIADAALDSLLLVFIGGEPTLWGVERLTTVAEAARGAAQESGKRLRIGVQSNGVRIDEGFIEWCRRFDVEPSFSIDGLPETSDVHRGQGASTLRNLRKLRDRGIAFGVIVVLTRGVARTMDAILELFRAEGFRKVRVNTMGTPPGGRSAEHATAEEITTAKIAIYRHMQRYGASAVNERNVTRQSQWFDAALRGGPPKKSHCEMLACGAGRETAVINPDGRWNMCAEKSMTDGLPGASTREALQATAAKYWKEHTDWRECESCAARHICDHGCAAYHHGSHDAFATECEATRRFFAFLLRERVIERYG